MADARVGRPTEARRRALGMWIWGAVLVVIAVVAVVSVVQKHHEDAVRVDTLYCTLSGIGPLDRGQETGRLCADLLHDAGLPGY